MRNYIKNSLLLVMTLMLVFTFSIPVYAADTTSGSYLLDDEAYLLDSEESAQVLEALETASTESNCNIVVITTLQGIPTATALNGYSSEYYTNNIFNQADTNYTVVLAVDMTSRVADVSTFNPNSPQNLNQDELDTLWDSVKGDLGSDDYVKAFTNYAKKAAKIAGSVNPDGTLNKSAFPWLTRILISLAIGFVISLIICIILKNQLKSVAMKANASDYIRPNSLNITGSRDNFLYSNVTKTAKPKNDSSGGGGGGRSSGGHSGGSF